MATTFEWRRTTPAWMVRAACEKCMRSKTHANYYNSAPQGAKEYIALIFYVSVYPDAMDEASYARQADEVLRSLGKEDLEYLIRYETDSQMCKVFMTRLIEVNRLNNLRVDSQKDILRQKSRILHTILKWFGVCAIGTIILSVLFFLIFMVITAHKGNKKNNLELEYERLNMLESKYGTNSVEYIEARIALIRKLCLNIKQSWVEPHRNFKDKLYKAGYGVSSPSYSNGILDSLMVYNLGTGAYGFMRRGLSEGQYRYPIWLSAEDAQLIWEHFYYQAMAECEENLANYEKLIPELEFQLDNLRTSANNDNQGAHRKTQLEQDQLDICRGEELLRKLQSESAMGLHEAAKETRGRAVVRFRAFIMAHEPTEEHPAKDMSPAQLENLERCYSCLLPLMAAYGSEKAEILAYGKKYRELFPNGKHRQDVETVLKPLEGN